MDTIADMLTRLRNSQDAGHGTVRIGYSKFKEEILKVVLEEGYIRSYKVEDIRAGVKELLVSLKYLRDGRSVIQDIHRVSKPGRRVYSMIDICRDYYNGLGVVILSTSKGVMSLSKARKLRLGGEIVCKIF